jgi:hypothetical protein
MSCCCQRRVQRHGFALRMGAQVRFLGELVFR